ncbi:MAG: UbiX family flavin prenyltransferase [Candidatus Sericytochromatia bacterium]|nr:UbiX family flavin prenyltransferase [Candidatus Sericytochromatia bacterium]
MTQSNSHNDRAIILAITGASGTVYGQRLLQVLLKAGHPVDLIISRNARLVAHQELDWQLPHEPGAVAAFLAERLDVPVDRLRVHGEANIAATVASGSHRVRAMAVVPCSMGTVGGIAHGISRNLIERAADVCLKERTPLVIVPRETPFSSIHLRNLLTLSDAGAIILPAMPGFYHRPASIAELVDHLVGKVLDQLGIENALFPRWEGMGAS